MENLLYYNLPEILRRSEVVALCRACGIRVRQARNWMREGEIPRMDSALTGVMQARYRKADVWGIIKAHRNRDQKEVAK